MILTSGKNDKVASIGSQERKFCLINECTIQIGAFRESESLINGVMYVNFVL